MNIYINRIYNDKNTYKPIKINLVDNSSKQKLISQIEEIAGLISGLIKYLKVTEIKGSKYSVESNNKNQTTKN